MTWKVTSYVTGETHVTPIDDVLTHKADEGCWCRPFVYEGAYVHNATDGRKLALRRERA